MLSRNQFKLLYAFYKEKIENKNIFKSKSQRNLAKDLNLSLGNINSIVKELNLSNLIDDENNITEKGIKSLEPYKVKNAIIMAAGMSSRFAPLSYEKPKGLLIVKNQVLIERQIEQLQESGIEDITIVVGYKKEMFFYLEEKYNIKIVVNEDYYKYNNPSTLIKVADSLSNTYICSSDNYFVENVFEGYVYDSYYSAVFEPGKTEEYCLTVDSNDKIVDVNVGGEASWYMLGHVYFSKEFSNKFINILKAEYDSIDVKEHLWEDLYIKHIKELNLFIKRYDSSVIKEFDSLDELREFDNCYINNTNSKILKNICKFLECEEIDIQEIKAIKEGLTNTSFYFTCRGIKYVYRHPGQGTENYIDRKSEAFSMKIAKELGLDDTYIYIDEKEGWKISYYIENARTLDYHNISDVKKSLQMIKKLHDANIKSDFDFDIWEASLDFVNKIKNIAGDQFKDFDELLARETKLYEATKKDGIEKRLCHCDCFEPNFLIDKNNKMYLIDWEYSGNDDPANDLGTYICCSDYSYEEALEIFEIYFGRKLTTNELRHFLAYVSLASYYWYVWAIYQESIGKKVGEYLYIWYKGAKEYYKKAMELY